MGDSRINVQIESGNEVISILPHTDTHNANSAVTGKNSTLS